MENKTNTVPEIRYYDGTKILSMLDLNGRKPEIYIVETNRTGGKTTYFGRLCVNRFIKHGEKFMLVYRFRYELDGCADKFFKDIGSLFFPGMQMTSKRMGQGTYHELFLDKKSCGYAIALNNADQIKKNAHLLSDTMRMVFDEFQSETNNYCPNEVRKLLSVHTSVARGQGKQIRYVPLYMLGNPVSLLNPYYTELGIAARLRDDTKFLRGDGFVMEHGFIESASKAQLESGFNRAFAGNSYVSFAAQSVYLNDNKAFIEKPAGVGRYLATLVYEGRSYGLREYAEAGVIYCDDRPDTSYPKRIAVTLEDHSINYIMLRNNDLFLSNLRFYFERGCFRFKDLSCKNAVLKALSY